MHVLRHALACGVLRLTGAGRAARLGHGGRGPARHRDAEAPGRHRRPHPARGGRLLRHALLHLQLTRARPRLLRRRGRGARAAARRPAPIRCARAGLRAPAQGPLDWAWHWWTPADRRPAAARRCRRAQRGRAQARRGRAPGHLRGYLERRPRRWATRSRTRATTWRAWTWRARSPFWPGTRPARAARPEAEPGVHDCGAHSADGLGRHAWLLKWECNGHAAYNVAYNVGASTYDVRTSQVL